MLDHDEIRETMEEEPGGENFGRTARLISADSDPAPEESAGRPLGGPEYLPESDGWIIERGTAHRGVLHPDEYVDPAILSEQVEEALGFTYADVSAAYTTGRPTAEQRQLREKIDARLLALSRGGSNMAVLAEALPISEKAIDRALVRAKARHVEPMVKTGVVRKTRVCFIEGTRDATPRRRRFSKSPSQWVGTIDLSDRAYARSFDDQPGNPAYWEFRERCVNG